MKWEDASLGLFCLLWSWTPAQNWLRPDQRDHSSETRSTLWFDLCGEGFVLRKDNEPKPASQLWQNYLKTKKDQGVPTVRDFPPQSPDISLKDREANHAETTWVSRFCTNFYSLCQLECILSLKQKIEIANSAIFWNSLTRFEASTFHSSWYHL